MVVKMDNTKDRNINTNHRDDITEKEILIKLIAHPSTQQKKSESNENNFFLTKPLLKEEEKRWFTYSNDALLRGPLKENKTRKFNFRRRD